ncbi:MAG: hypothetical protein EBR10_11325, partial [Planctomycetes bacterium]|nr:hypothetical protein [Planctomycetota bacterium]
MANLHETNAALTTNSGVVPLKSIPRLGFEVFRREIIQRVAAGGRVMSLFGVPVDGRRTDIFGVVEVPASPKAIAVFSTHLETNRYESMTLDCPEVHLFERELGEQCGLIAERHPWFKPVRYAKPLPRPGGNFPD